ncbi:GTP cyclohydrolase IB [Methylophilaceae bacterium]|nr:GTP cyclohydrolase IB [Methylophilaceae bacterium]
MNLIRDAFMEDVQNLPDLRELAIDQVGIRDIRHPLRVVQRDGGIQHSVATVSMAVALSALVKGTHMSRFIELLNDQEDAMTVASFRCLLHTMVERLEARSGSISMRFPYFIKKEAPVSGVQSLLDYEYTLLGEIRPSGETAISLRILVPVTSLCPCSKKISQYGAHNQRSHVTITAHIAETMWVEDIIDLVEAQASAQLYGLLKRPDEKFVTEQAYDNPKFVEDMVRDIAGQLSRDTRIVNYTVECENFESIHNHSAFAVIYGK